MASSQEVLTKRLQFICSESKECIVQILSLPELEAHDFIDFVGHLETIFWHESSQKDQLIHQHNNVHQAPQMIE